MATSAGVEIAWPPTAGQLLPHELVHPSLALALSGPGTTAAEAGGGVGFFAARCVNDVDSVEFRPRRLQTAPTLL